MFNHIEQLVRLLLTIPCSNAEAERSFSSLRRLKTYLRNSMNQERLNHFGSSSYSQRLIGQDWHRCDYMRICCENGDSSRNVWTLLELCLSTRVAVLCYAPVHDSCVTCVVKKRGKGAYSSSWNSPQNYGTPLVNWITQCYLPPDRGDRPPCMATL